MEKYKNLNRVLNEIVQDVAVTYKEKLINNNKSSSGTLIKSIKAEPAKLQGNLYTGSLSLAEHWKYVEYGRKPGKFPPINNLITWVQEKNLLPRPTTLSEANKIKSLAYLIGRKIAKDGIQPGGYLGSSLDEVLAKYDNKLKQAVSQDIDSELILLFKNTLSNIK